MADEQYTFAQARTRLEEIVAQVRKKDTSLEKSLDLLEEGVRLANICTELSDHTEWQSVIDERADSDDDVASDSAEDPGDDGEAREPDGDHESVDDDRGTGLEDEGGLTADAGLEGDGGSDDDTSPS